MFTARMTVRRAESVARQWMSGMGNRRIDCMRCTIVFRGWLIVAALSVGCEIRDQPPEAETELTRSVPSSTHGQLAFVNGYDCGCQLAREHRKPMLVFFTADWCKYCRQMAAEAFVDEVVVDLSRQFVCVLVDADAETSVCRRFEVRSFPTVQFVSPDGVRLHRVIGKQPSRQLIAQMRTALEALASRSNNTSPR
jgi:thiol:disulfide interchange protein